MDANTRAMMQYDARKKSVAVCYLLALFLGGVGAHRFYAGRIASGIAYVVLFLVGAVLSVVGIGLIAFGILAIWMIVDLFLIPGMIREHNLKLSETIVAESAAVAP